MYHIWTPCEIGGIHVSARRSTEVATFCRAPRPGWPLQRVCAGLNQRALPSEGLAPAPPSHHVQRLQSHLVTLHKVIHAQ